MNGRMIQFDILDKWIIQILLVQKCLLGEKTRLHQLENSDCVGRTGHATRDLELY